MFNFIKMDVRRLFRSLSFYIIIGIFMFITCMNIYDDYNTLKNRNENEVNQSQEVTDGDEDSDDGDGVNAGLYVGNDISRLKQVSFARLLRGLYGGNSLIFFVALVMTIFICTEYQSGYIKNISTISKYRWYNIISKMVTGMVVLLSFNLLGAGAYFVAAKCILDHAVVGSMASAMKVIGIQLLIQLAIVALYIFVCTLGRSKALCITVGILLSTQMLALPGILLSSKLLDVEPSKIAKYLLTFQTALCTNTAAASVFERATILSLVWIVVLTVASCYIFKKRDI